MIRFYAITIRVQVRGSALLFTQPALLGQVLVSVADTIKDERRLYVCNAADEEHAKNLGVEGLKEVSEAAAVELAATFQPARTLVLTDSRTGAEEQLEMPACNLRVLLAGGYSGAIGAELL